jgi:hypothetical protein
MLLRTKPKETSTSGIDALFGKIKNVLSGVRCRKQMMCREIIQEIRHTTLEKDFEDFANCYSSAITLEGRSSEL